MVRQFLVSVLALHLFAWFMDPAPAAAQTQPPPQQRQAPPAQQQYQTAPPPGAPAPQPPPAVRPPQDPMKAIDAARRNYQQGKLLQSTEDLDAAITAIYGKLGQRYAQTLPAPPRGYTVEQPDAQRMAAMNGGGIATARDYRQTGGQGLLNARIVLDSGAGEAMQPLFQPQLPQGVPNTVRKTKINNQDAVVAYDPQRKAGEVSMLVGNRILLQVEGQNIANADILVAVMQQWNLGELRRLAGM